ncbi:MAG: type I-E CRISPR-associated protein Cas7/Cse4/CasC [Thermomicrobiales bacterium]
MIVELHLLQNFAPSNLNRDDTGSPKDCEFGGYRRARISSQCLKRSIRAAFSERALLEEDERATRTKRLTDEIARRLAEQGKDEATARAVVEAALGGIGLTVTDEGKTQYLLFLGRSEIGAVTGACLDHWDELSAIVPASGGEELAGRGRGGREAKRAGRAAVPDAVKRAVLGALDGRKAADVALFGRMLADLPERNVDAASQVAHALSTNKVNVEFDFYTAVDDLKPEDTAGADMLGTVEFNSACFYRYANVSVAQLGTNLNDPGLAERTIEAFVRASVAAIPTGKQNSMAAQNPPSAIFAVVRRDGPWSLANAFLNPVRPMDGRDLMANSVRALDGYWAGLTAMYGDSGIVAHAICLLEPDGLEALAEARVATLDEVVATVMGAVGPVLRGEPAA